MHPNIGKMPCGRSDFKKKKIWPSIKGGPFDYRDFEKFLYVCRETITEDELKPILA